MNIEKKNDLEYFVQGKQEYKSCECIVESDYSQFAFYAVLGAINHNITCKGLNINSLQGDKEILKILDSFKVNYVIENDEITIYKASCLDDRRNY